MEGKEKKSLKIFSLSSNEKLAQKISDSIGIKLGEKNVTKFSDGETRINIEESVRGDRVFIIQSMSNPVNDHIMETLIMIDALKRASAKSINVVIPYYGYSRQDKKMRSREPISAKLLANLLTTAGANRIITLDLHAVQIQGFFDLPVDHLNGVPLLANSFLKKGLVNDETVIVSPDHGGVNRARKFSEFVGSSPLAIIDRRISTYNATEEINLIGDVKNKNCIVVDDIIDTAETAINSAEILIKAGAKMVYVCATHAVLSGEAINRINSSSIERVIVTDSIDSTQNNMSLKLEEVTISILIAKTISNIYDYMPISPLFDEIPD